MKTVFGTIIDDWKLAKNLCRATDNKQFSEKEPSETFIKKLLIAEHSPVRVITFNWAWEGIRSWVATHWSRHKWECFISTQREDRMKDGLPRDEKPQGMPVTFNGNANMQNLIDTWRKRLCYQASPETRDLAEDFKITLAKTHPVEASALVPNCIYRCGCPEFIACGFLRGFWEYAMREHPDADIFDIQTRYDIYNEYFRKCKKVE